MSAQAEADRDYRVSPADLAAWERAHGPIAAGAIVLILDRVGQPLARPRPSAS